MPRLLTIPCAWANSTTFNRITGGMRLYDWRQRHALTRKYGDRKGKG